ncbi:bifunctional methionine sulfoxide reductase [Tritrichomonas foetus]|uniref:peptide-methionine (S)-S-oxide reductase n=1 Tax=Tritrichomonas foetus TaxID=1144522 RepID=A0A1J4JTB2_9EUKA|nr:bifunctional methionine sulfoxide reductase [Tritrichomonas foetus]|eukprot:OHT01978.1 bifunctional methionine sulfoxide reductase [Tritrichomonas foetus]
MMKAYFACGCFWGAQYYFEKAKGVKSTTVGYMGGHLNNPTYSDVKKGTTGHLETTEVEYDPSVISYENLVKYFFEIHDFSQENGQGPDIGSQYLSGIFTSNQDEIDTCNKVIGLLKKKGHKVATKVLPGATFWKAEDYHQLYYQHKGHAPYCHVHKKIF